MGYCIQYESGRVDRQFISNATQKQRKKRILVNVAMFAVLILFLMHSSSNGWLENAIYPGDAKVTKASLEALVEDIRNGDSIAEAFTAFCKGIIDGANLS